MKKLFSLVASIIMFTTFSYSQAFFKADSVIANVGDSVIVSIDVGNISNVGSMTLYLEFDQNVLSWGRALNWNNELLNGQHLANANNGVVAISWASLSGINITNGKLLDLKFLFNGQNSPIEFSSNCEITDSIGNLILPTPNYIDGYVSVGIDVSIMSFFPTICLGDSIQLGTTVYGGFGNYTYTWASEPVGFVSAVPHPYVSPLVTTTYSVTVSDGTNTGNSSLTISIFSEGIPSQVSNMLPSDSATTLSMPINLSWMPANNATLYDIYIWEVGGSISQFPEFPDQSLINMSLNNQVEYGSSYNWQVVSKNQCFEVAGPIQNFTLRNLPDIVVNNIQTSPSIFSGQDLAVEW